MAKRFITIVFMLLIANQITCFAQAKNAFIPYQDETTRKWGYVDAKKNIKIPYQFETASKFSDGLANVFIFDLEKSLSYFAFIDTTGNIVLKIDPKDYNKAEDFRHGFSIVRKNSNYPNELGGINKKGDIILPIKYCFIGEFDNYGLAIIKTNCNSLGNNTGLLDTLGNIIIPTKYTEIGKFINGVTYFSVDQEFYSEELGKFTSQTKYGLIDLKGKEIVAAKYDRIGLTTNGLWTTYIKGKGKGLINNAGDEIILKTPFEDPKIRNKFLSRYAYWDNKLVRLFDMCEERIFNKKILSYEELVKSDDILEYGNYWYKIEGENGPENGRLKTDSITNVMLMEELDLGQNYYGDFLTYNKEYYSGDNNELIKNYITTDVFYDSLKNEKFITGYFSNTKHYTQDIDCFVARVNLNESQLNRKITWLKEFSVKVDEEKLINNWGLNILKSDDDFIYLLSTSARNKNQLIKMDLSGEVKWTTDIAPHSLGFVKDYAVGLKLLKNSNIIVTFSQYVDRRGTTRKYFNENTPMALECYNNNTGQLLWKNEKIGDESKGEFGGTIIYEDCFIVAINYWSYIKNKAVEYSKAKSTETPIRMEYLTNVMLLKYNNNGELMNTKLMESDEPRFTKSSIKIGNDQIKLEGFKGLHLNEYYYVVINKNLEVISTNSKFD